MKPCATGNEYNMEQLAFLTDNWYEVEIRLKPHALMCIVENFINFEIAIFD